MPTPVNSTQRVDAQESERGKAPFVVTCLAFLYLLVGVHEVVVFLGAATGTSTDGTRDELFGPFSALARLAIAFLFLVAGFGLKVRARWGQAGAVLVAVLVALACLVGGGITAVGAVTHPPELGGSSAALRIVEIGVLFAIAIALSLLHVAVTIGEEMTRWSRSP